MTKLRRSLLWNVNAAHAVFVTRIREEMQKDEVKRIAKGDWEKHKSDKDLHVQQELLVAEGPIFRECRIKLPPAVQWKVVKLRHSLGHLRKTMTKQMLREKYWSPLVNGMIDTKGERRRTSQGDHHPKPPLGHCILRPWWTVPSWHYNLVLINKRTRFPVVESIPTSTPTRRD